MKSLVISTFIAVIALVLLGVFTHSPEAIVIAIALSVLEVSLSCDNAVMNATVLSKMNEVWRRRFIYIGLPIAVLGMRLIFPILIVALTTPLSVLQVYHVAVYEPQIYQKALVQGMPLISGFGGGFLFMVFLNFLLDHEREVKWLRWLESHQVILKMAHFPCMPLIVAGIIGLGVGSMIQSAGFLYAFALGALLNFSLHFCQKKIQSLTFLSAGFAGFIYLELLDASFSMDGVIGAFTMSDDIFVIMVGLGIGALFVRSFTIQMVKHQTLKKWLYLEHGAHYAIGFLACVMCFNVYHPVPELITAGVSIVILILSAYTSRKG